MWTISGKCSYANSAPGTKLLLTNRRISGSTDLKDDDFGIGQDDPGRFSRQGCSQRGGGTEDRNRLSGIRGQDKSAARRSEEIIKKLVVLFHLDERTALDLIVKVEVAENKGFEGADPAPQILDLIGLARREIAGFESAGVIFIFRFGVGTGGGLVGTGEGGESSLVALLQIGAEGFDEESFVHPERSREKNRRGAAFCGTVADEFVHNAMIRHCKISFAMLLVVVAAKAEESPGWSAEIRGKIAAGQCIVLEKRPDEVGESDSRFVTVAAMVEGSRETIWEVINDKKNAADFLDGVLESKVIEQQGNRILVEQLTRVGGPRGSYRYRLWHELRPMSRADFTYAGGELRNVLGSWWIFDGPKDTACFVVYSLHIDPGLLAPQVVVKAGMRKTMPQTIQSIAKEVARRK